jgi:uncharacterized protein
MADVLTHDDIAERLQTKRAALTDLRVRSLHVFGSIARRSAGPSSDVDMLVEFDGPRTFEGFMRTKQLLEEVLGRDVDLATVQALRVEMRDKILREAVRVA